MSVVAERSGGRGYVDRASGGGSSSLADVVSLILDKGLVIDVFVRVSLVGIEILTIDARIVVASVDTYLRFAEATNRLDLYEKGGKDLPGLVQGITEGGAKGKTSGVLEAAAEKVEDILAAGRQEQERGASPRAAATATEGARRVNAIDTAVRPRHVYGLIKAEHRGSRRPARARALGPRCRRSRTDGWPRSSATSRLDRPLGVRSDLLAHEAVLDAVAARAAVVPMRFPSVVEEEAVVAELLAPNEDYFLALLEELEGCVQFTLMGRYEQDAILREVVAGDNRIRALSHVVRVLPEDAAYFERVRLGELIVQALDERRRIEGARIVERLRPLAVTTTSNPLAAAEDVVNEAFLVERKRQQKFDDAVEEMGKELVGRVRLRLLGPVAPYDFTEGE